jgi:hypothetical protein
MSKYLTTDGVEVTASLNEAGHWDITFPDGEKREAAPDNFEAEFTEKGK